MKRALSLVTMLILVLSVVGCSSYDAPTNQNCETSIVDFDVGEVAQTTIQLEVYADPLVVEVVLIKPFTPFLFQKSHEIANTGLRSYSWDRDQRILMPRHAYSNI